MHAYLFSKICSVVFLKIFEGELNRGVILLFQEKRFLLCRLFNKPLNNN